MARSIDVKDIESLKPADVAPVVRCKDCKNWSREDYGYCFVHDRQIWEDVTETAAMMEG